jgi:two-component system cell cycle sensor histidine kinase/response regulator CckA
VLEEHGYTVLEASGWQSAIGLAESHGGPIHLLLTDVVMPEMGGPEVASRLSVLRPGIKVLYMSGYTNDAVLRRGLLDAGVAFLQKPFSRNEVARRVRELLDGP